MPRNPDIRQRLPSITAKFSTITDMRPEEKALLVRIGNLIDATVIAERAFNDPRATPGTKFSEDVPVPQNITSTIIMDGIVLKWDPVDFNEFEIYEVQFAKTTTFSTFTSQFATVNTVTLRDNVNETVFARVRTISRRGTASAFSATQTINVQNSLFEVDTDFDFFENRTTVNPQPITLGASIDTVSGDSFFVSVGGSVGPSPLTLTDLVGIKTDIEGNAIVNSLRNQISYVIEENDTTRGFGLAGIPDAFDEDAFSRFYPFVGGFYLDTNKCIFSLKSHFLFCLFSIYLYIYIVYIRINAFSR